jgi:hypothetical protein
MQTPGVNICVFKFFSTGICFFENHGHGFGKGKFFWCYISRFTSKLHVSNGQYINPLFESRYQRFLLLKLKLKTPLNNENLLKKLSFNQPFEFFSFSKPKQNASLNEQQYDAYNYQPIVFIIRYKSDFPDA